MPSVKMLYLRDGNEYLSSKARRTPLALHDKRHKGAGPLGTVHSFTPHMGVDPLFPWPKRPEFHWTLESLLESAPPPIKGRDIQLAWLGPEYSFWAQPMLPD